MWQEQEGDFNRNQMDEPPYYIPTKAGLLVRQFDYRQIEKIKLGGLLKIESHGNNTYVTKGRIDASIQVSPDGCSAAYLDDDRKYIDARHPALFYKLKVVKLC